MSIADIIGWVRERLSRQVTVVRYPDNPYVPEAEADFMLRQIMAFTGTMFPLVEKNLAVAFATVMQLMPCTSAMATPGMSVVDVDRAWSWEISRAAFLGFAHDTDPDHMYLPADAMTWILDGQTLNFAAEVAAFTDAAFAEDPEAALRVADSLRPLGHKYLPGEDPRVAGSQLTRVLNAFVLLDLTGTYGAQVAPEWMDLTLSPIMNGDDDDDE